MKKKLAIIGSGVAGISAAYFLHHQYEIDLYEKDNRLGGHTHTVDVEEEKGQVSIDTGFMVYNEVNYPNLVKLFSRLSVETKATEMSLSVCDHLSGFEYCGNRLETIFARKSNLLNPRFLKMLWEVKHFHRAAKKILSSPQSYQMTLREFISQSHYGRYFSWYYLLPFITAVWSTPPLKMLDFPIYALVDFLQNHGLLNYPDMFEWKTVKGGSKTYLERILKKISIQAFPSSQITQVKELPGPKKQIRVSFRSSRSQKKSMTSRTYDKVVMAVHADQALAMIENPSPQHKQWLSAFPYQENITYLHTDPNPLPKIRKNWASWNVRVKLNDRQNPVFSSTYYSNELQRLSAQNDYFLTLNPFIPLAEDKIIKKMIYHHPTFSHRSLAAQKQLPQLNLNRAPLKNLFFCGSYFGYGFHEDALLSSVKMCEAILGRELEWA